MLKLRFYQQWKISNYNLKILIKFTWFSLLVQHTEIHFKAKRFMSKLNLINPAIGQHLAEAIIASLWIKMELMPHPWRRLSLFGVTWNLWICSMIQVNHVTHKAERKKTLFKYLNAFNLRVYAMCNSICVGVCRWLYVRSTCLFGEYLNFGPGV